MPACPHCRADGVGHWRKWGSGPTFPAQCRQCDGLSYVPSGRSSDLLLQMTLWLIASGLSAALLNSVWPLFIGGLTGLFAYFRRWRGSQLIATDRATTEKTRGRHAILNAIALLLTYLWS